MQRDEVAVIIRSTGSSEVVMLVEGCGRDSLLALRLLDAGNCPFGSVALEDEDINLPLDTLHPRTVGIEEGLGECLPWKFSSEMIVSISEPNGDNGYGCPKLSELPSGSARREG